MTRRGRPRSVRAAAALVIDTKLRLYPGEDDDLIAFFANIPLGLRASMIKGALRSGVRTTEEVAADDNTWRDALEAFVA
mgnify:CR=1 FL=1